MKNLFADRSLIVGICLELAAVLGYSPVTNYFYYGGGWPFVQIFFIIIYLVGSRYIFSSNAPTYLKIILVFWWVGYVGIGLMFVFFEE
ncbi:MAG: hypothetical protein HYR67_02575 [Bacteroidetes bacterium]|nr:hypothetical protein [Bacteroidota bacterium]